MMNEPKLRFKADDGNAFPDWEEKTVGDMTVELQDYEPLSSGYPLMTSSRTGLMMQNEFRSKSSTDDSTAIFSVVPRGMATYRHMSDDDIFHFNINNLVYRGLVSKEYPVFNTKDNYNLYLLVEYLNSSRNFLNFCKAQKKGGTRTRLYFKVLKDFKLNMPSFPEQQKIAEFLSTIDTVIAKQKETVSAWEERKKGVMQKLFSQEVRFKADDGSDFPEWEEKSYLSICNVFADGDWIESKDQSDSGIRLIQTGNIGNGVFIDKDDKKKYISKETFDRLKCNEVFEGDILISRLPSPAGRACIVPKLNERMITAVDCTIVRTDKSIILHDYCVQFMQSSKHFYYVASMMAGGTRQRISRKNLEDELISVPCLEEQQKIADCLSSLDEVIEKQKATLAAWEELKKGLLQQMFV